MKFFILFTVIFSNFLYAKSAEDMWCCENQISWNLFRTKENEVKYYSMPKGAGGTCESRNGDKTVDAGFCPDLQIKNGQQCCKLKNGEHVVTSSSQDCTNKGGSISNTESQWETNACRALAEMKLGILDKSLTHKFSNGKADTSGACGDCVVRETLVDDVWKPWNGFDLTDSSGKFVKHIQKTSQCTPENETLKRCNIQATVIAEEPVPTPENEKTVDNCEWLERQVIHVTPTATGCSGETAVCAGRAYCTGPSYPENSADSIQQVSCVATSDGLCPENVSACMTEATSVLCVDKEKQQKNEKYNTAPTEAVTE